MQMDNVESIEIVILFFVIWIKLCKKNESNQTINKCVLNIVATHFSLPAKENVYMQTFYVRFEGKNCNVTNDT